MEASTSGSGPARPVASLVERLRTIHLAMLDAVLSGDGLERVAELAAETAGGTVVIAIPRIGVTVGAPTLPDLATLGRYVGDRVGDRPARVPDGVSQEVPIQSGDELIGCVLGLGASAPEALDVLHLAAVASLTDVAIEEAKEEVEQNLRGSLLEDIRSRPDLDPREIARRAGRLGCELTYGAVVLCAELSSDRPRHVVAMICGEHRGALAQHMDGRVYALLPATDAQQPQEETLAAARRLATRLQRHGTVGLSGFAAAPADLGRAVQEAELVLDVLRGGAMPVAEDIGSGTYRLLFRVLASHPEEVRSFYEDTVAPIVRYDTQYSTDLIGTLDAYLAHNCNMNATAAAIFAHRHTVAYRLERVRELAGLDPMQSEDRERLGLGLKAYRIIAPRLPR